MNKVCFILGVLLFQIGIMSGQNISGEDKEIAKADRLYQIAHFSQAIPHYHNSLERNFSALACARLATCHRKIGDNLSAEYWFAQAVKSDGLNADFYLGYAEVLRENGKGEEAKKWFQKFDRFGGDSNWKIAYLISAEVAKATPKYEVKAMPFNSSWSESLPAFHSDGIIYASDKPYSRSQTDYSSAWSGKNYFDLFLVRNALGKSNNPDGLDFDDAIRVKGNLNSPWHDIGYSVDPKSGEIWITRTTSKSGKKIRDGNRVVRMGIYSGVATGSTLGKMARFNIIQKGFSAAHPSFSPNGNRLYFSSDLPGGSGGMDIWYVDRLATGWGIPVNAGTTINSSGDELFPYCAAENRLFFSSRGHPGLGGLDIYESELKEGVWASPVNQGVPLNSSRDDFGFIIRSGQGYFSSNRTGSVGGDDIFAFQQISIELNVVVTDKNTAEPVGNANIEMIMANTSNVQSNAQSKTDNKGLAQFSLSPGNKFYLTVNAPGYSTAVISNILNRKSISVKLIHDSNSQKDSQLEQNKGASQNDELEGIIRNDNSTTIASGDKTGNNFHIRLGVYRNPDMRKLNNLSQFGQLEETISAEGLHTFHLGPYSFLETANKALQQVKINGFLDAFIEQY
jgi:tetratricopeptide (TPR) repeat protein